MIICNVCGKPTSVAIKGQFLCFTCYDKQQKSKPYVVRVDYFPGGGSFIREIEQL